MFSSLRGGGAQCLEFLNGRLELAEIGAADRLQLPGLQVLGIERHHPRKQRERPRVVFLPQVDQSQVQEDWLVVRAQLKRPPVGGNRLVGASRAGIDHAEIAERGDVARLLPQNGLEAPLRGLVVIGRQSPDRPVENVFRGLGGPGGKDAEGHAYRPPHTVIIVPDSP